MKSMRIWALRRSGHHAIMEWLKNCASLREEANICNDLMNLRLRELHISKKAQRTLSRYKQYVRHSDVVFYNIEDKPVRKENIKKYVHAIGLPVSATMDIIVLRDPFNLFASRFRSAKVKPTITKEFGVAPEYIISTYKQHAQVYLRGKIKRINYNLWFKSRAYRKRTATDIGLEFTDSGVHDVANYGGGSSFDGLEYAGNANKMDVLNRWKVYKNNKKFFRIFDDEQLIGLSSKIYPEETKDFLDNI